LGRDEEALPELRLAVASDPNREGVHRRMGAIHARAGRLQQAVNQFEKELQVNPKDAETLTEVGIFDLQTGQITEAAERLESAVALAPKSPRARQYLAEVRFKQSRQQEGLDLQ